MLGVYIHVPFCATRCGYCDFNTYTPGELGSAASTDAYLDALARELELGAAQAPGPSWTAPTPRAARSPPLGKPSTPASATSTWT